MFDYKKYLKEIADYMVKEGYTEKPLPSVKLHTNEQDEPLFISTGNYDPDNKIVNLYTYGRHPKDVLRSFAHELIHHKQNMEGRLGDDAYSGDRIVDDDKLIKLEAEAYLKGNLAFRSWTETVHRDE
jgi:hypothetical protein